MSWRLVGLLGVPGLQVADVFFCEVKNPRKLADWVPFENCQRVKKQRACRRTEAPVGAISWMACSMVGAGWGKRTEVPDHTDRTVDGGSAVH